MRYPRLCLCALATLVLSGGVVLATDWPQWGRDNSRNMVATEKGLPESAETGKPKADGGPIDLATTKNVKWASRLGSQSYGNATVAGGRVFVGTNNASPRLTKYDGDYGVLLCFSETDGGFLWQLAVPKLRVGKASDFEQVGLCSPPTVDGDRVYVVTNRCEVLCLASAGRREKNAGPFLDEAQYSAGPGKPSIAQGAGDADIIWRYDMRDELGVFPRNMTSSAVMVLGGKLFVTTSNGVDWTGKHLPAPDAPALICLDKQSGKLLGRERSGISRRTRVCNWSSPAAGEVGGKPLVVFGGGDGFCYGFDPDPSSPEADGIGTIREVWRFDCNPVEHRLKNGEPIKYGATEGPSDVIATPVILGGRVYVAVGQDPEAGDGVGCLSCIDASKTGDISATGAIWRYTKIGRSLSTVSIADGLLYVGEYAGIVHCLDVKTGTPLWTHDTEGHIWGSVLLADGKLYAGNENGVMTVLAAGKEKQVLGTIDFKEAIYSSPVGANGVLYVGTQTQLYALKKD